TGRGWAGLLVGLAGVLLLLGPKLENPADFVRDLSPLLVLGSACAWSLGSLLMRHHRLQGSHLTAAAYQMIVGGSCLTLVGLAAGEVQQLPEQITPGAVGAFCYLLIVGSLVGFVAYNWLLGHVSAAQASTYAYVNPAVAVLVGWADGEDMTPWLLGGIAVILAGVALVRGGGRRPHRRDACATSAGPDDADEGLPRGYHKEVRITR
ncbi:MAG TPA: EamA family transporter, partial [Gemmataceae bacterium]|nr:EamA family transporter [Gemmataceae bacterium]